MTLSDLQIIYRAISTLVIRCSLFVDVFRQALTVYEQLRLDEFDDDNRASRVLAAPDDDLGTRYNDYVGLARRVLDHCRQYSDVIQNAMHRETIYQG